MDIPSIDKEEGMQILFGNWVSTFSEYIDNSNNRIQIIVPFISEKGANMLLSNVNSQVEIYIITRLNDQDFINHASDIDALIKLQKHGCHIRVQNRKLHSKLYLFDKSVGVITSSNLTKSGLMSNYEIGVSISKLYFVQSILDHFNDTWRALSPDITIEELFDIRTNLIYHNLYTSGKLKQEKGLKDRGKNLSRRKTSSREAKQEKHLDLIENEKNKWIKFMWRRNSPAPLDYDISKFSDALGAVTFPKYPGHPRNINVGDQIFHTALTKTHRGKDWLVFGRGDVAIEHRPSIDELSHELRKMASDLDRYPYLIWLCNIELIRGQLKQGVSLHELFIEFGDQTFIWSKEQSKIGRPDRHKEGISYHRSHIKLTDEATEYLNFLLDEKFSEHGKVLLKSGNNVWWNDTLGPRLRFLKK